MRIPLTLFFIKHGIKVTGHLCSVSFQEAVALGIDNLEHGFFTNTDYVLYQHRL